MKRTWKQIASLLLVVCMVMTMLPAVAFAESDGTAPLDAGRTITAFAALDEGVAAKRVQIGTLKDALDLPGTLYATVSGVATPILVTWSAAPVYDGNAAQNYTFTPVLPDGYTLAPGVSTPQITVTVEADMPVMRQVDEGGSIIIAQSDGIRTIKEAIEDALSSSSTVTVKGLKAGVAEPLDLTINSGKKVVWKADYRGTSGYVGNLINLKGTGINGEGAGTFEVADGGAIAATYQIAISSYACNVLVTGSGRVQAIEENAIATFANVTVSDNAIVSARTIPITAKGENSSVSINGGVVFGMIGTIDNIITMTGGKKPTIDNSAVVIAWDGNQYYAGKKNYAQGSTTHISTNAGTTATWAIDGGDCGIAYKNGGQSGLLKLPVIVLDGAVGTLVSEGVALKTELVKTEAQTVVLNGNITMTEKITLGASHTLIIPSGKSLSTNGKAISWADDKQLTVKGGGTLSVTGSRIGIEATSGELNLENITVNLQASGFPSLSVKTININSGATVNVDAPQSGNFSVIQQAAVITVNSGATLNIASYEKKGVENVSGKMHIKGGTIRIAAGSNNATGLLAGSELIITDGGQLLSDVGGKIELSEENSSVSGMNGVFKDRGTVVTATGSINVNAYKGSIAPSDSALTSGIYAWDGTHFSKTADVTWSGLSANGGANTIDTTALTLTFNVNPSTLTADNITVTGATKGDLTGTGYNRTLAISNITAAQGQDVTVEITTPDGYNITPVTQTVAVNRGAASPQALPVPSIPQVTWQQDNSFTVSWSPVTNSSGYKIRIYKDGASTPIADQFINNTVLSSDPDSTDPGSYTFSVAAVGDGISYLNSPYSSQSEPCVFPRVVGPVPVITSASSETFTIGTAGSFTVAASNSPTAFTVGGDALPAGVSFNNTTGVLSGTPAAGTNGTYRLAFTAANAAGTSSPQSFTLTVQSAGGSMHTVTFNISGGTRTGGGALTQTVASGGSVTAPTVARSGYTFTGWDKTFTNVTSNMTVTATWRENGGAGDYTPPIIAPVAPPATPAPTAAPRPTTAPMMNTSPAGSGTAATALSGGATVAVTSGSLTLRDAKGNAIGMLSGGDRLVKIGQQGAWTLVQLSDGTTGRVASAYLGDAGAAATGGITSNTLTVRSSAGGAAIGRLGKADTFTILDIADGWAKIRLADGTVCYAAQQYIRAEAAQAAQATITSQSLALRDAKGNLVGKLSADDTFSILYVKGNWATILLNGETYCVFKQYIEVK